MRKFIQLMRRHREIDALFERHQRAIVQGRRRQARLLLLKFSDEIRTHMEFEENVLFSIFARAGPIPGASIEILRNEHRKISRSLRRLERLSFVDVVATLEEEYRFKELLRHHGLREKNAFYPALDRVATPEEREELKKAR